MRKDNTSLSCTKKMLPAVIYIAAAAAFFLSGCAPQIYPSLQDRRISLDAKDLQSYGVAFITPSTVTGQEEEKQAVALAFTEILAKTRPDIRCVTLAETINAVNKAGISVDYKAMFVDYRDTGIFKRDTLQKIGFATNTRYVAQLKLANFSQGSNTRLGVLGLRLLETKYAKIRLFLQIWDTRNGSIAWESICEMQYAVEAFKEKAVTLHMVMERASADLIARLP
ncbi:MAG: hypothetical protein PHG91_06815 [Syntrophales bacterium]|nr:hypothetical protein [Syntrophales bacterium]MDD5233089.1 hypothetical protein [Syntrophales bacterium]MDD5533240.1 hypothetical protein [Syntrophales bacterium]